MKSAILSRRLGAIWTALVGTGFMSMAERDFFAVDMEKWEKFEDLPQLFRDRILDFEKLHKVNPKDYE